MPPWDSVLPAPVTNAVMVPLAIADQRPRPWETVQTASSEEFVSFQRMKTCCPGFTCGLQSGIWSLLASTTKGCVNHGTRNQQPQPNGEAVRTCERGSTLSCYQASRCAPVSATCDWTMGLITSTCHTMFCWFCTRLQFRHSRDLCGRIS